MPQFRYAFDADDCLTDVLALPSDHALHNGPFSCAGCGKQVSAKTKGEHRVKHFAHKAAAPTCTEETYLHRLAKRVFREVYTECLAQNEPFTIELEHPATCDRYAGVFGTPCENHRVWRDHDLTQYYDAIDEERRDGDFIPDLLLRNTRGKNGTVYIELAVTHKLSPAKWASDRRIIELNIRHEDDIARIRAKRLGRADALFLHFAAARLPLPAADCYCAKRCYFCFCVYNSGRCHMPYISLDALAGERRRRGQSLVYSRVHDARYEYPPAAGELFQRMVEDAYRDGLRLKNCYLCRYHGENRRPEEGKPIFCRLKRLACGSNEAVACDKFLPRHDLAAPPATN